MSTQWQAALEGFMMDNDMATLQCLVLAQIHCLLKADYSKLLKYKGLAIGLSQRLGLHQSQKRFALGALTSETRKKVFWSLYTVDW
ncbi:DNA-binding transcription factor cat8 [Paraconiothyrium brasiliense]|uniref:DNA-binding transcription factor cat8 n=1 Tax=Paraconiothyrium brasiliense TaxID=300254 RepID=A0ABR3QKY1_9PLEO